MNHFPPRSPRTIAIGLIVISLIILALGGYLTPVIRVAVSPIVSIQTWVSTRFMALYGFLTIPTDVKTLQSRNAELEDENSQLQTQIIELQQNLSEAQAINALVGFARQNPGNEYIAATVIGVDPSPFIKYVYINAGSDVGLRHGMPVVTQEGLVGRIDAVIPGAARVQLITDPAFSVNIKLKSSGVSAVLTGSLTGDITLEMISRDTSVMVGDVVLTSGLGGTYPSNLFIGQVQSVQVTENALFSTVTVQPMVNFSDLSAILVITNFNAVDLTPLQPTTSP
jgi:rod shape-determining protein MreC